MVLDKKGNKEVKISHLEFIKLAIAHRSNPEKYKGIHIVISGFNAGFREYFKEEPRPILEKLSQEGKIVVKPCKAGAMMFLPEDVKKEDKKVAVNPLLQRMGLIK